MHDQSSDRSAPNGPIEPFLPGLSRSYRRAGIATRGALALAGSLVLVAGVSTVLARGAGGQVQVPTTAADFFLPGTQPNPDVEQFDPVVGSVNCTYCHSDYGVDLAPFDSWVASVMGQSARDPVWHAALTIANQDANIGGETCIRCHAPGAWLGGRSSTGTTDDFIQEDYDGINCNFCHRVVNPTLGPNSAVGYPGDPAEPDVPIISALAKQGLLPLGAGNARYVIDPDDARRGPFSDVPVNLHGQSSSGQPVRLITSPYHRSSEFCGTCHDVSNPIYSKTPKGDYVLNALGAAHPTQNPHDMFPEQRTYSEWLNSSYVNGVEYADGRYGGNDPDGVVSSCQDCHMPKVIAGGCVFYQFGEPWVERPDMPQHSFAGSNTWVVQAIRNQLGPDEADAIGLTQDRIDAASARTVQMLQNASDMTLSQMGANLKVRVTNESGHKIPSGYPEGRRMWVNVKFLNAKGTVVAERGAYNSATAVLTTADTKVYEAKHGTTQAIAKLTGIPAGPNFHLALANKRFFDNRIPPRGFSNAAFSAIGSAPVGYAYADGQHWDDTSYAIPSGATQAVVTLYYQTTTKEYIEFLRDANVTDAKGQAAYDLWVGTGKSAPVAMDTATVALVPAVVGDLDGNGVVNGADLAILLGAWGTAGPGDLNGDGVVNAADLALLLGNWG
jgi:nitrate/TMAO reductase-like tetraheme cytochrome c subunit